MERKEEIKTTFEYEFRRSKFSRNYAYFIEIQTDQFGRTEESKSAPLTKEQITKLKNQIERLIMKMN